MEYISCIENIYHNHSIYKSIFVCTSQLLEECYRILQRHDYPVCKVSDMDKFNNHMSRIMIIDEFDVHNFSLIVPKISLDEVNLVLCIDSDLKIKQLKNVPYIFL
jgi:hypothetical protein